MFGMHGTVSGRVNLTQKTATFGMKMQNNPVSKPFISIIDQTFDFLPRLFTITTQNGSYKFNIELLSDSSKTISSQLESNPNNLEYHLDIKDYKNTMKKFECIYYGLSQTFEFDELHTIRQIIKILKIDNCPIYFKPDISNVYSIPSKIEIEIERNSLQNFLNTKFQDTFTINTNHNKYQCSKLGVISSKVISELKASNPEMNEYKFDFDDENGEFEDVCNLFNFQIIKITVDNMDSLKQISDELKIEPIINSIDNFVNVYEKSVQQIDDKKVIIDIIDDISSLLHNIQTLTVESVKKSILNSIWVKTEENVQELAAYILQAARIGYKLHTYLIDLIISLDKSADDNNKLSTLLPYLINILKFSFQTTSFYSSFYLKMAQKGIVEMEEVLNDAMKILTYTPKEGQLREYWNKDILNILKWFLPELFERNKNNIDFYNIQIDSDSSSFFKKFLPSNLDEYKNMRDSGMPLDDISRAIYIDDVDTLQSIISKHGIDINDAKVPSSIFDVFVYGPQLYTLINYSVMNGSVKCFKYLLLNHAEMNDLTFILSIYGGNTEIIRSVNQNAPNILHSNAISLNRGFNNIGNQ